MKENRILKFTGLVMFVSVIAVILVSGTYAKYTSSVSGSDTATVAKWDIKAGVAGEEVSITGSNATVSFNLFDTILDTETGETETDVTTGKIAPGTMGSFELSVKNDSEVNAEYTIAFELDVTSLPLEFKINDGEWTSSLSDIDTTALDMNTSDTATVQWRWAYETTADDGTTTAGDTIDTNLGLNPSEVNVTATLIVSQVD